MLYAWLVGVAVVAMMALAFWWRPQRKVRDVCAMADLYSDEDDR